MSLLLRACAVVVAAAATISMAWAQPTTSPRPFKRVLTIHSGAESYPGSANFDATITKVLYAHPAMEIDYYVEFLENEEFGETADAALRDYIRTKFRDRPPDIVIANTVPAVQFALRHRAELFPDVPLVFIAAAPPAELLRREIPGVTGMVRDPSQAETLEVALQLHPGTTRVHVVAFAPAVNGYQQRVQAQLMPSAQRVTMTFANEPTLEEALAAIKHLPADSLLLYARYSPITKGRVIFPDEMLPQIAEASPVPIYSAIETNLGKGVVGGMMRNEIASYVRLGETTLRILEGEKPENIPIEAIRMAPIFDWRELERWGIPESRLPPGSVVRYRAPTLWQEHKAAVLSAVGVLAVQSLLIVALLHQRRARRRAEVESRKNLALAADASRRHTMSALTSTIAHELGQPLSAMIHNAQAGRRMLTVNQATPDTISDILSDIETEGVQATLIIDRLRAMLRTHQLDRKSVELQAVIDESLALVAHEMRARRIEATVNVSSTPCIITGDRVLLQQVLVNLLINAMDAMAETPPARRRVTISTEVISADVKISVGDNGTGLPAQIQNTMFTPFVTTKAQGLGVGLAVARTILDAHGGAIDARNNPEGGATFTVTLRCSETPKSRSVAPSTA
jgi:signal transduction histidine kinase